MSGCDEHFWHFFLGFVWAEVELVESETPRDTCLFLLNICRLSDQKLRTGGKNGENSTNTIVGGLAWAKKQSKYQVIEIFGILLSAQLISIIWKFGL